MDQQPADLSQILITRLPALSLISGIFALFSCCTPPMQMLIGSTAIFAAYLSGQGKPLSGMARTGMILGIISIICSLVVFFQYMAALELMASPEHAGLVREILRQYEEIFNSLQPTQ